MITPNELVFTVDENDNPLPPLSRLEVHNQGIWHRISHVWVVNNQKQILCQQRSITKDNHPGMWEPFFGGHVGAGETYEEGAVKEANEELGLSFVQKDLHFFTKAQKDNGRGTKHFQAAYYVFWNGSLQYLHIEKEEVEQVVWKDIADLEEILLVHKDPNWVHVVYEKKMLEKLNVVQITK